MVMPPELHHEAILAAAYAALLLLAALGLEWLARRAHQRTDRYELAGFVYHPHLDTWECPTGQHLALAEVDQVRRRARYRARADTCNRCPLKPRCTDSDQGREVQRPLDPWPHSEVARFHCGLSLVLVVLAGLLSGLGLVRNHADADLLVLVPVLAAVVLVAQRLVPALLASTPNAPPVC